MYRRQQEKKLYHFVEKNLVGSVPPVSFAMLGRYLPLFYVPVILFPSTQTPSGIKQCLIVVCNPFVAAFLKIYICLCVCVYIYKENISLF